MLMQLTLHSPLPQQMIRVWRHLLKQKPPGACFAATEAHFFGFWFLEFWLGGP
jgi:hypothetical protein